MIEVKDWDGKQTNVVIHGDCESVMKKMKIKVDLTFTSPPYSVGEVLSVSSQPQVRAGAVASNYETYDSIEDQIPDSKYFEWLTEIKSKSHLTFWNVPAKQFEKNFGVEPKEALGQIIWAKPNAIPFPKRGIIYFHEFIWVFGDKNKILKPIRSTWNNVVNYRSKHPAPFPIELPAKAIQACTNEGDIVFDPFGGSGTTAAVAKAMGRNFITCDVSTQYCEWMDERIEKTKLMR